MVAFHRRRRSAAASTPAPPDFLRPAVLAAEVEIHERDREKLVLDGADAVVRRAISREIHPPVVEQRGGGHPRAARARVLVRVRRLERRADLLQQSARAAVILELLRRFPGDVHSAVTRREVAREPPPLIGRGERLRDVGRPRRQDQAGDQTFAVQVPHAAVEPLEIGNAGRVRRRIRGFATCAQHKAAQVIELLRGAGVGHLAEARLVQGREPELGGAHPEMRLVEPGRTALGVCPMMQVGRPDESRRVRCRRGERAGFVIPRGDVAGDVIVPGPRLGRREPDLHAPPTIPIAGHRVGALARRPELDPQVHRHVRVRVRRGIPFSELEYHIARRVRRRVVAWLRGRHLRPQSEGDERRKHPAQSDAHDLSLLCGCAITPAAGPAGRRGPLPAERQACGSA
jgi:hypothetical protein